MPSSFSTLVVPSMAKVFINDQFQGVLKCPNCENTIIVRLLRIFRAFNRGDKPFNVKCRCGNVVEALCDFRQFPRVKVNLEGLLRHPGTHENVGTVTINSLSLGGVSFFLHARLAVKKGEVFELVFALDNAERSVLEEEIVVSHATDDYLGAEFRDKDAYNYVLDFYIPNYRSSEKIP